MPCRYCGQNKKLIDAHVIPSAFFRRIPLDQGTPRLLTNDDRVYAKRAPDGAYDKTILCADCESIFGDWDCYAQSILADEPPASSELRVGDRLVGLELGPYRYEHLKLFFISVCWRASVSSHPFYTTLQLGPYEVLAKRHIENRDPGAAEDFATFLAKFDDPVIGKVFLNPHRDRIDGVNYVRFYLAGYVAYVKTDRRPTPKPFRHFMLASDQPLRIVGRQFWESKEVWLMQKIATRQKNRGVSR
jgi:hypothetical protein